MQPTKHPTSTTDEGASVSDHDSPPESFLTKDRKTPGVNVVMSLLPETYEPSPHDVICGRGRQCKNWAGNLAYREMIQSKLGEYSAAVGKNAKGDILDSIIGEIRRRSGSGGFIKKDEKTGRWYEVGDFLAREKTSQCFRDALHNQYTSSAQAKYKRRKRERERSRKAVKIDHTSSPSTEDPSRVHRTPSENAVGAALQELAARKPTSTGQLPRLGHGSVAGILDHQPTNQLGQAMFESLAVNQAAARHTSLQQSIPALNPPQPKASSIFPMLLAGHLGSLNDPSQQHQGHQDGMGPSIASILSSMTKNTTSEIQRLIAELSARQNQSNRSFYQQLASLPSTSGLSSIPGLALLRSNAQLSSLLGSGSSGGEGAVTTRMLVEQLLETLPRNNAPNAVVSSSTDTSSPSLSAVASALRGAASSNIRSEENNRLAQIGVGKVAAPADEAPEIASALEKVRICALQPSLRQPGESLLESTRTVIRKMEAIVEERRNYKQDSIDLFVLPELSPVGYSKDTFQNYLPNTPKMQEIYNQIDTAFSAAAYKLRTHVCYGTIGWNDSGSLFIRQKTVDPTGALVATYDKIHLCDYGDCSEASFFAAGDGNQAPVFTIKGIRFGMLICADMRFPGLCQQLVRDGRVDALLQPAAFARDISFRTWKSFRETRAVENSVYFVGVNYAGEDFGETCVCPPWIDDENKPLVLGTEDSQLTTTIERNVLAHVRSTMPFYKHLLQGTCCVGSSSELAVDSERS